MREFKFLLYSFFRYQILQLLAIGIMVMLANFFLNSEFFSYYYSGFPMIVIFTYFITSATSVSAYTNTALSFGASRKNMLISLHINAVVLTIIGVILCVFVGILQVSDTDKFSTIYMFNKNTWLVYTISILVSQIIGFGCNVIMNKSKIWGVISISAFMVVFMALLVIYQVIYKADLVLWNDLFEVILIILPIVIGISITISEIFFIRYMKTVQVR